MPEYRAKVKCQHNGRLWYPGNTVHADAPPSHLWEEIGGPANKSPELLKRQPIEPAKPFNPPKRRPGRPKKGKPKK